MTFIERASLAAAVAVKSPENHVVYNQLLKYALFARLTRVLWRKRIVPVRVRKRRLREAEPARSGAGALVPSPRWQQRSPSSPQPRPGDNPHFTAPANSLPAQQLAQILASANPSHIWSKLGIFFFPPLSVSQLRWAVLIQEYWMSNERKTTCKANATLHLI